MAKNICIACPFNDGVTEEACQAQNYGCLPTKEEMIDIFNKTGKSLSCHEDGSKPCQGLMSVKKVDINRLLEYSDWYRSGVK